MEGPGLAYSLILLYLLAVLVGPRIMRTRPALDLKPLLVIYNAALVLLSAYMFWEFLASSVLNPDLNLWCQDVDRSDDPRALRLAGACWWYFFSKYIEFLDTIFFVLRKKNRQISFLHVYHHATMPALWWIGVKIVPGGSSYFGAMINCAIHVLMYSYYALSACGPAVQKYLWWKKYLTSLQMAQFVLVFTHTLGLAVLRCGFPQVFVYALLLYMLSLILLFANFYQQTYRKHTAAHSNGASNTYHTGEKLANGGSRNGLHRRNAVRVTERFAEV